MLNHVTVVSRTTEIWPFEFRQILILDVSLNSRDSFPRWKFKNRAPKGCSHTLWPPTISFELHAEMAEEIDLEKCTFRNFGSSVTLTLTLDRVEVTVLRVCGRGLPTHQIRWKSEKLFVDVRTYGRTNGHT